MNEKKIRKRQTIKEIDLRDWDISYKLNEMIKISREKAGFTTKGGSQILDITEDEYIKIEKGEKPITKDIITPLIQAYKMPKKIKNLAQDPKKTIFAQRITELRIKTNKTQEETSKILGIALSTYAGYESGRREPDIKTIIKIADLYQVSADYLIGRY